MTTSGGTPRSHDGQDHEEPPVGPAGPSGVSGVWAHAPKPLLGPIHVPPLTDEQFADFRARFEAAAGGAAQWTAFHEKAFAAASPRVESRRERRRRLGLRWWQREAR